MITDGNFDIIDHGDYWEVSFSSPEEKTFEKNSTFDKEPVSEPSLDQMKKRTENINTLFDILGPPPRDFKKEMEEFNKSVKKVKKEIKGVKKSSNKPLVALLDIQFPKALRAISRASMAGHEKYKETDKDYKNFKRVPDAERQYRNASRRHELDRAESYLDEEIGIPHIVLKAWNTLAELEIHLENKDG